MAARKRRFRILSLSGGGFLGLYTAKVLDAIETRVGEPLGRRFDLLAGTSVGGVIALALAFEVPMRTVVSLFVEHGREIFSARGVPRGTVGRLLDMSRSVLAPKYSGDALGDLLDATLGERTLADAKHPIVIPAVNVTTGATKVFKTPHAPLSRGDEALRARDVGMATCAAPTYFPPHRIGNALFADGGLFAVAPDQIALHEARHFMGVDPDGVRMLSVGTAVAGYQPGDTLRTDGAVGWLGDGRLILTLMAVQQQHVQAMMEDVLGRRYLRIDAPWPAGEGLAIDVATPAAIATLGGLADWTLESIEAAALDRFL